MTKLTAIPVAKNVAVAAVCPGPIAAQLGQGVPWALATLAGLVLGLLAFSRRTAAAAG